MATPLDHLDSFGNRVLQSVDAFGSVVRFTLTTIRWAVTGTHGFGRLRLLLPQLYQVGTRSLPVLMLTGMFVGMVLAVEAYHNFQSLGQESKLGGLINVSVIRQLGPVLAAVMIAGRVGSAISAELGTMRVTEQLDALQAMGADPVAYLVVPRVAACLIMVPCLSVFSNLMGIYGGYLVTVRGFGVSSSAYWEFSNEFVHAFDLWSGLFKSMCFGLAIGVISCYKGFHCKPGAAGVGQAATDSFVASFMAIIVMNFFLAKFLNDFYAVFIQ